MSEDLTPLDVRQLWIKTMASGDYHYVKGKLATYDHTHGTAHCAFGVLDQIAREHGHRFPYVINTEQSLAAWAGLNMSEGGKVVSINDNPDTDDYSPVITYIENLPLPEQDTK